jgi:hypothetical protein
MRYTRHQTVAIDRRFRQSVEFQGQRQKAQLARREALAKEFAEKTGQPVTELSHLMNLEVVIDTTISDVDDLQRIRTELDHNRALEAGIVFEEQLDRLIDSALARRNDALEQLELYRTGLSHRWRLISDGIIDAEATEVAERAKEITTLFLASDNQDPAGFDESFPQATKCSLNPIR